MAAGIVSGAAGDPLIIGGANLAGSSNTSLNTTSSGFAWQMFQQGNGVGVFAISNGGNALAGLAHSGNRYALSATNDGSTGTGAAIIADGRNNVAIRASSDTGNGIIADSGTCTGILCGRTGVIGNGFGFAGGVLGEGPLGVVGVDSTGGSGFGFITGGDASIGGDLSVGSCTGCLAAVLGTNGGGSALSQGDAVTATGATTDADGNVFVVVEKAGGGDAVFGIASTAVDGVQSALDGDAFTKYKDSGATVAAGDNLRIITGGVVTFAAADASGGAIAAGDELVASADAGKLAKAGAESSASPAFGIALGTLADGRVVVFID